MCRNECDKLVDSKVGLFFFDFIQNCITDSGGNIAAAFSSVSLSGRWAEILSLPAHWWNDL